MLTFTPTDYLVAYMSVTKFQKLHEVNLLFPRINVRREFLASSDEGDGERTFCDVFIGATYHIGATISIFQLEINDERGPFTVLIHCTGTYPISPRSLTTALPKMIQCHHST